MFSRLPLIAAAIAAIAAPAAAAPFAGLVGGNQLVGFDSATPGVITATLNVSGLNAGDSLIGIDTRPATGEFYALGALSTLYTINTLTGAATFVAGLSTPLSGGSFDIAFNPVPDRIRIVSDADQSLRVVPTTGAATVDGSLAYAAGDANSGNPNVTAVAYRNQVAGTVTATELFGIDLDRDILVAINPPNNGTLVTRGALGVDASGAAGFDIVGNDQAFASLTVAGSPGFYGIDLNTGAATLIGTFSVNVADIAQAQIGTPVPEPVSMSILGMGLMGLIATRRRRA